MSAVSAKSRKQTISSFLDALDRHDVEVMMSHMSDECVFETASGPEIFGFRYLGREDVRTGYSSLWKDLSDAHWVVSSIEVCGDRAFSEWTVSATLPDGTWFEADGVDLFEFEREKISVTISYRKF